MGSNYFFIKNKFVTVELLYPGGLGGKTMMKRELNAKMAAMGAMLIPFIAQADQPMSFGGGSNVESSQSSSKSLPGEKLKQGQIPAGYNQSAYYTCKNPWDVFLTGDYIYWAWQQEIMQVGTMIEPISLGSSAFLNGTTDIVLQTPGYASGFQLGLGGNLRGMDNWNIHADYTWYKNTDSLHTVASSTQNLAVSPTLIKHVNGATPGVLISDNITTTAELMYNAVDLVFERPFYLGRKLTANFIAGFQALWISEKFTGNGSDLSFVGTNSLIVNRLDGSFSSETKQKSWGLGPKFGFDSNWLLGSGIKIMSKASLSALYTSYITLSSSLTGVVSDISLANLTISQSDNYNTVNPVAEASLGLGWGSYLYNNNFHFDISASYDFKVFWNQNVVNAVLLESSGSPGNMSLRGLNVQVRFDF